MRHRPAVLLVTHDVEEAVRLADRVAVLRDGRLVTDETVDIARPRDPGDPAFAALRRMGSWPTSASTPPHLSFRPPYPPKPE